MDIEETMRQRRAQNEAIMRRHWVGVTETLLYTQCDCMIIGMI